MVYKDNLIFIPTPSVAFFNIFSLFLVFCILHILCNCIYYFIHILCNYICIYPVCWSLDSWIYSLVSVINIGKCSVNTAMNIFSCFFFFLPLLVFPLFVVYTLCNNSTVPGYFFHALHFFSLHLSFVNFY